MKQWQGIICILHMLTAFGDTKRFEKVVCEPNCIAIVADTFNANFFKINGANVSDMSTGFVIRTNPFNGDAISEVSIKIKSNLPNIPVSVYNNGQESMNFTIIVQTNSDSLEDIKITAQNYFNFGNNYTIKIGDLENELNMVHEYDDSNKCSAADIVFGAAHFTSQWAPSFDNIRIDDRKKMINITFSGAPSQFCIEEYQIDLMNVNTSKIETKFIHKDMLSSNGDNYFNGVVSFKYLLSDNYYKATIVASKHRVVDKVCLCIKDDWTCGCLEETSNLILLKTPIAFNKQFTERSVEKESGKVLLTIMGIAGLIFGVMSVFVCLLIVTKLMKSNTRKNKKKSKLIGDDDSNDGSWIYRGSKCGKIMENQKILFIHSKNKEACLLAKELVDKKCVVVLDEWDTKKIHKNKHLWISNALKNVDKILFIPQTNKEEQNTDVYSTLISCINLNDPRVIIIIFESECLEIDVTSIPLYTEKLYILPRDKKLLMNNALSLTSRFSTDSTSTQELLSDVDSVYDDINQNKEEDDCTTHFPLNESDQDMAVALGISTFDRTSQICEETV